MKHREIEPERRVAVYIHVLEYPGDDIIVFTVDVFPIVGFISPYCDGDPQGVV